MYGAIGLALAASGCTATSSRCASAWGSAAPSRRRVRAGPAVPAGPPSGVAGRDSQHDRRVRVPGHRPRALRPAGAGAAHPRAGAAATDRANPNTSGSSSARMGCTSASGPKRSGAVTWNPNPAIMLAIPASHPDGGPAGTAGPARPRSRLGAADPPGAGTARGGGGAPARRERQPYRPVHSRACFPASLRFRSGDSGYFSDTFRPFVPAAFQPLALARKRRADYTCPHPNRHQG